MRQFIITIFVCLFFSCGKKVENEDVIKGITFSNTTVNADGTSTVDIAVTINENAGTDKRNVVFTATGGDLVNAANGKLVVPATFQNTKLIANAIWRAPMSAGDFTITAKPEVLSVNADYLVTGKITALLVSPASIKLEPSSFGLASNFLSTDTITGTLKNNNKKVSIGAKVKFEDLLSSGFSAGGRFRNQSLSSDGSSQVRTMYSAANLPLGTNIYMEVSVLDAAGNKTAIRDTVILTINQ